MNLKIFFFTFLSITKSSLSISNNSELETAKKLLKESFTSRAINSRPFSSVIQVPLQEPFDSSQFVKSHWKVWDRPEDQIAIETGENSSVGIKGHFLNRRKNKQYATIQVSNGTQGHQQRYTPVNAVQTITTAPAEEKYSGTQRQGCNSNLQVTFFPVVLVLIATIAGLITIVIVWFIARKWMEVPVTITGGHQFNNDGGWSGSGQGRFSNNFAGFSKLLQKVDMDQLTSLVTNGIDTYRKYYGDKS